MKKKTIRAPRVQPQRPGQIAQRLRRLRYDVGIVMNALDDALAHADQEIADDNSEQRTA